MGTPIPIEPPEPPPPLWPPALDPDKYYCIVWDMYAPNSVDCDGEVEGRITCCALGSAINDCWPDGGPCGTCSYICVSTPPCGKLLLDVSGPYDDYDQCADNCDIG